MFLIMKSPPVINKTWRELTFAEEQRYLDFAIYLTRQGYNDLNPMDYDQMLELAQQIFEKQNRSDDGRRDQNSSGRIT